jgi:hypothetical protein
MAAVTTERLMQIALEMAEMTETPSDSRVEYPGTRISHILFGIDVGPAELFMARQLGYHAVIAQRPHAVSAEAWRLVEWHEQRLRELGARGDRQDLGLREMELGLRAAALADNQDVMPSLARLLDMPLVTIASPLEELARQRVQQIADDLSLAKPEAMAGDLRDALLALPEFAAAPVKPELVAGAEDAPLGKVLALPGGLAAPSRKLVAAYATAGITTLLHPESAAAFAPTAVAEDHPGVCLLVTGRIATASLGANPYIVRLRTEGLEVRAFAGVLPAEP